MKFLVYFLCTALTSLAYGQGDEKKSEQPKAKAAAISPENAVRINYTFPAWNLDPKKVDAASIMMRETATGHLVQIRLVETAPDSGTFSGKYLIKWQNLEQFKVEFYRPPQELLDSNKGMKQIAEMIADKKLRRNPFILRRTPTGAQTVEIFETRQQAEIVLASYNAEMQTQGLQNEKYPPDQAVDTAELAEKRKLQAATAAADAARLGIEQAETIKLSKLLADEGAASSAERKDRKAKAQTLGAAGMELYKAGKFQEATDKFSQAIELDPENHAFYFQYGVSLYKIDQFNKSIVYLQLADGPDVNPVEKGFFIGLNFFRLKDFPKAVDSFDKVIASKDPEMAPAASYYEGVIDFEEKKWEPAKAAFQVVLDTTKDPQIDQRSEQYITQILRIQQFETERARKWQISTTVGEQYDSNVNLNSNSALSQGSVTNVDGYRSLLMGSVRYRPIYEEDHEFAAMFNFLTMYTVDTTLSYNQTLRNADPTVATLTAPWTYKGVAFGKGYKLDLSPGLEEIGMSVEDNTQKMILYSYLFNISNLFVMSDGLYSNFNVELRQDINQLASEIGINDPSAFKVKLINSNLHFLTADKSKIITSEVDVTLNNASGANMTYDRIDLAVGYIQPFFWNTTGLAKLGYFYLDYPTNLSGRTDNSYTLTAGGSKKLSDLYSAGLVGTYNINQSNVDAYTYNKWTMMLTFSALYAF